MVGIVPTVRTVGYKYTVRSADSEIASARPLFTIHCSLFTISANILKMKTYRTIAGLNTVFLLVTLLAINACVFSSRLYVEDALVSMRAIRGAQMEYLSRFGRYGVLTDLAREQLIKSEMSDGENSRYTFNIQISESGYTLEAYPDSDVGSCFFMDQTGVIRASYNWQKRADRNSEAIGKQ